MRHFFRYSMMLVWLVFTGCEPDAQTSDRDEKKEVLPRERFFTDISESSGLEFHHELAGERTYFFPEIMSPGAALFDFDRDGDLDVYLVNGTKSSFATKSPDGFDSDEARNRLFRQEPDGTFVDVTDLSRLGDPGFGMGVAVGDVNNDGLPDVYLSNYGPDRLYLNRGNGTFEDITTRAGIDNNRWSASAAFFDYNRDGWLDLFVTNYVDYQPDQLCHTSSGTLDYCNPAKFPPTSDRLYLNLTGSNEAEPKTASVDGAVENVRFSDTSLSSGIATKLGAGLGVICVDLTDDGWPDIYVANDGNENRLWVNQQDGTFRDEAVIRGLAFDALGRNQASMGIAVGDLNDDQLPDIVLTHLEGEYNTLYLSSKAGTYRDSSRVCGLFDTSLASTGFGVALSDLDHDGDLDLAVANGRVRRSISQDRTSTTRTSADTNSFWKVYAETNQLFWNDGQARFQLDPARDAEFAMPEEISRALVYGDIDNDGDLDLLVTNTAGLARLYRNELPNQGHWLSIRAVDPALGGRDAIGAVVRIHAGERSWMRIVAPGASYCSSHDPRQHFGIGEAGAVDSIEILWPNGLREKFEGTQADQFLVLQRGEGISP